MIRTVLTLAVAIVLFLFLIWPGHFWGRPIWDVAFGEPSAQNTQLAQRVQQVLPTSTPYPTPTMQAALPTYTPNPTYTPLPSVAPAPTTAPAMTATPVPAKPAAAAAPTPGTRGPTDPPVPWKEVEQPGFAGDTRKVYNHDNARLPHVYLTWYLVGLNADPNDPNKVTTDLGQCSIRVTTDLAGERLSTFGAWRKFALEGNAVYTKEQLQELVRFWVQVLEREPRGACAQPGKYVVSWQDTNLAPANPQGRP